MTSSTCYLLKRKSKDS